jgi:ABC-type glycerol-3-phosphate transport system permease component
MITKYISKFFSQLGVWGWTVIVLIPFFFIMLFGTKDTSEIYSRPLGLIYKPKWENFSSAWNAGPDDGTIGVWFINTGLLVATALFVSLVVAVPAAYFTIFLPAKAARRVMVTVLAGTVVPTILLVIPYFKAYNQFGFLNKPIAAGVAYGTLAIPTTFLLMNRFFLDFPREILEAGLLDGLSNFRIFRKLVLPLSVGQIVSVGILTLIWAWGDSQIAIVLLQSQSAQPISVGMLSFAADFTTNLGATFAGLSMAAIPPVILYIILSKYVTKGIALGGISK